jgi:F-type H+-transporting ATPase subunit alpha
LDLAQFNELQAFAQFGSDLDAGTKAKLERGRRIVELFKQVQFNPMSLGLEAGVLYAMQNGYFDDVPVNRVKEFQQGLEEDLKANHDDLLRKIQAEKVLTDEIDAELKAAISKFKSLWS